MQVEVMAELAAATATDPGDHRAVAAVEGQLAVGTVNGGRALVAQRDTGGADRQRPGAIGIRYAHAQPVAADADARVHAQRVVVEADNTFRPRRRCRPGADPVLVARHRSLPQIACWRRSCRRNRCRCNDFDEAITPREPGRPGKITLCDSAALY